MITLEQAKLHLRVDHDAEDALIQSLIDASIAAVADYLETDVTTLTADMPTPVEAAVLLQVADLYENREAQAERAYYKNPTFERLLNPYRAIEA